jgi:hypothetical protein
MRFESSPLQKIYTPPRRECFVILVTLYMNVCLLNERLLRNKKKNEYYQLNSNYLRNEN